MRTYQIATVALSVASTCAFELDVSSRSSILDGASTTAYGLMSWYNGNETGGIPGNLPAPYFWWEAGALMMSMVSYWYYTGDITYNSVVKEAILWQVGPDRDFMTPNQTLSQGNDDQSFWAFAAMEAAELGFEDPSPAEPQWVQLAQAVFHQQTFRWHRETCGGGLKWQIYPFNKGYKYKNTISNGCYFSLGARLARYTGNTSYVDLAERAWDWLVDVDLISQDYSVFDGTDEAINCSEPNPMQWSYNHGVLLHGAANLWNVSTNLTSKRKTRDEKWRSAVNGLLDGIERLYVPEKDNVLVETACQPVKTCNQDQQSFKAFLSRWMAATTLLAPWTSARIMPILRASAVGAARQCSGGSAASAQPGRTCGMDWHSAAWDAIYGPGPQMAAMSAISSLLVTESYAPLTESTGATSVSDATAGIVTEDKINPHPYEITTADRAGAAMVTIVVLVLLVGTCIWIAF